MASCYKSSIPRNVLSREAANINLIVLGLRSLGSNPRSIYHTGEHANHYTNDAVFLLHHAFNTQLVPYLLLFKTELFTQYMIKTTRIN